MKPGVNPVRKIVSNNMQVELSELKPSSCYDVKIVRLSNEMKPCVNSVWKIVFKYYGGIRHLIFACTNMRDIALFT